ncbi:Uncharacterised protein [Mycobacteroides abscessus subsp. abscessus]|nr:Uncharacterised protein [Mycobacteroides abscessus subsp. abscessus]
MFEPTAAATQVYFSASDFNSASISALGFDPISRPPPGPPIPPRIPAYPAPAAMPGGMPIPIP